MSADPTGKTDWPYPQQEGKAHFQVGDAFFRSSSRMGRDLAVLAASVYKARYSHLRVLDAMTGCGVRPLRYALEAGADAVWANEGNVDLRSLVKTNLSQLPPNQYKISHQDANAAFFDCYARQDFYDLVDVDSFGSPMPSLSTALWAVKIGGLLYLTSTDGRATSGRAAVRSLRTYGAYARSHPAVHEQGLRLLLGLAMQQAAARGLSAEPIFSLYNGEVNRVMVRITRDPWPAEQYGFLAYCHRCGQFQTVGWKRLGRATCVCRVEDSPVMSGPMWLGPLHSKSWLTEMAEVAAQRSEQPAWNNGLSLLHKMQAEVDLPPYFYPLGEIGKRGKTDIPPMAELIQRLRQQGFRASGTHIDTQAIKTDAPFAVCLASAQQIIREVGDQLSQRSPRPE